MHFRTPIAVVTALAVSAGATHAQSKVDRRWQLDMDGAVRIHNYNGTVTIRGWDRDTIHVTGTIASKGGDAFFGGGGRSGVKMGVGDGTENAPLADLTLMVPARARVQVRGAATSIDIRDFAGAVDATTLSGRLFVSGAPTEVMAETMDGDLEVHASPAFFRGRSATGRITWSGSSDDVSLVSVGGAITVNSATVFRARFESISGDIKFAGNVKVDGRVSFDSHGGDISIAFAKETRAELTYDGARATVLGAESVRDPKKPGQRVVGIPRGVFAGTTRPANVIANTFKGRLTVTQP
jgi:hypothetical protein